MNKIIALNGSTRQISTNSSLIKAIADLSSDFFEIKIFDGLCGLPHFNPDLDYDTPPKEIAEFRQQLREADGILICSPEYAMGVPGTLKNAIDWTVSSMEFLRKPTALITASSLGQKSHESLLGTLQIIESKITDETQLLIPHAKTKISKEAKIVDDKTLDQVRSLLFAFEKMFHSL